MNGTANRLTIFAAFALIASGCGAPGQSDLTSIEASFAKSDNAPVSRVSGGGTVVVPEGRSTYAFHASSNGTDEVKGRFELHFSSVEAKVHGNVTCLLVTANHARLAGVVTRSSNESLVPVGTVYTWQAIDNGEGNNAPPDRVSGFAPVPSPTFCNYNDFTDKDWTNGNVQIK